MVCRCAFLKKYEIYGGILGNHPKEKGGAIPFSHSFWKFARVGVTKSIFHNSPYTAAKKDERETLFSAITIADS